METFLKWVGWKPLGSTTPANPQVVIIDAQVMSNDVSAILGRIRGYARAYDAARLFIVVFAAHEWTPPQARTAGEHLTHAVRDASIQFYDRLVGQINPLGPGVAVWMDSPSAYPTFVMHDPATGVWSARTSFSTRHMQVAGESYVRIALWVARLSQGGAIRSLNVVSSRAPGATLRTLLAILLALDRGDPKTTIKTIMWLDTTLLINRFFVDSGGGLTVSDADILWALMLCSPDYVQPTLPRAWGTPSEIRERGAKNDRLRVVMDKRTRTLLTDPEELHRVITKTVSAERTEDVTPEIHDMEDTFVRDSPLILIVWELETKGFPSVESVAPGDVTWLIERGPTALLRDELQSQEPVQRIIAAYDAWYGARQETWDAWVQGLPAHKGDLRAYARDHLVIKTYGGAGPFTRYLTDTLMGVNGTADRWGKEWWWPDPWGATYGFVQRLMWNAIYLLLATDTLAACFWADRGTFYLSLGGDGGGPTGWGWSLRGKRLHTPSPLDPPATTWPRIYETHEEARSGAHECWEPHKAYPISQWTFNKVMIEAVPGVPSWLWLIILRDIPDKAYDPAFLKKELTWRYHFLTQLGAPEPTEVMLKLIKDTWKGLLVTDSVHIPWDTWAAILVRYFLPLSHGSVRNPRARRRLSAGGPLARDAWRAFTSKPWVHRLAVLEAYVELTDAWEVFCDVYLGGPYSDSHIDLLATDPFAPEEDLVRIGSPGGVVGWTQALDDITGQSFSRSTGPLDDPQWRIIKASSPAPMLRVWNWRPWSWVSRWNEYLSLVSDPVVSQTNMLRWEAQSLKLLPSPSSVPENPAFLVDFLLRWDLRDAWVSGEHTDRLMATWEAHHEWLSYAYDPLYQGYHGFALVPLGAGHGDLWIVSQDYFHAGNTDIVQRPPGNPDIPLAGGLEYIVDPTDHDKVLGMIFMGWEPSLASKFWRVYASRILGSKGIWDEDTLARIVTTVLDRWGTSKHLQSYRTFYSAYFHRRPKTLTWA